MHDLPLLLGHRGARATKSVAENTLPSFEMAVQQGCHGFEFDVRLTGDGRAVVCHDDRYAGLEVARSSYAELQQAGLKAHKQTKGQEKPDGCGLATLDEVLAGFCRRVFLDIELKVPGIETRTLEALRDYPPEHGAVVSSFLPDVVLEMKGRSARAEVGLICESAEQLALWPRLPVEYVVPHIRLVNQELVTKLKGAGKRCLVWTVNDAATMLKLAEWGVDGIISDDTKLLVQTFAAGW